MTENTCPSISIFFPAFNDGATIAPLVTKGLKLLRTLTDDFEVIVINDGSTDATKAVLTELAANSNNVKVIHHSENLGYGAALRSGFDAAQKELVFYTDGDGQYDVNDLPLLLSSLRPDVDLVNGYKIRRADGKSRKILGAAYNRLVRIFFNIPVRDVDCDFRIVRGSLMKKIDLESTGGSVCVELIHKLAAAGCRFADVPVPHYPRLSGRSQFFRPRPIANLAGSVVSMWFRLVLLPKILRSYNRKTEAQLATSDENCFQGVLKR